MKTYNNFTEAYVDILKDVYTKPGFISSPRGMLVKENLGYQFCISNPRNRIPYVPGRDTSIHYLIAELLWYLSGTDSVEWISNYSAFWPKISDDGKTANSAYGARIFRSHDRIAGDINKSWSQWGYVVEELKKDPDSRRAVIHIRSPKDSLLANLDVPCTLSLQFFLRNDRVHMIVSMRSSDVVFGLTYDVPAFTLFQELLALQLTHELGRPIGLGTYTHLSASLHIYERHFKMAEKILEEDKKQDYLNILQMPRMPSIPSLHRMMLIQADLRAAINVKRVLEIVEDIPNSVELKDDYWVDWCKVLASHRAMKLGDADASENILSSTTFEGYKYFMKGKS